MKLVSSIKISYCYYYELVFGVITLWYFFFSLVDMGYFAPHCTCFLSFCNWFFKNISSDGRHFISQLRINGSAIESIYSILKFTGGGMIIMASNLQTAILEYSYVVNNHNSSLIMGTLNWVRYSI